MQYKNYMREEKVKQQLKREDPKKDWEEEVKKYQGRELVDRIMLEAHQLDTQAKRKE